MQATLDAYSLKAFTRALTCISKYGDEVSIHATSDSLSFSATNSSKSAFCLFKYDKQFFSRYELDSGNGTIDNLEEGHGLTGQLTVKSFLLILKHRTVEKSVERCELSIIEGADAADVGEEDEGHDSLESKLIIRFHCKHGVVKTHRLVLLTSGSILTPGIPDPTSESRLTIGPRPLKDLLDHFPVVKGARSDPQLVWTFEDNELCLKSMESSIDSRGRGQLSTEISISSDEFDVYNIFETPTTLAFHLREFNAAIAFADSTSLSLDMRFTEPAIPLFIEMEGDTLGILFVISTSHVYGAPQNTQRNTQAAQTRKRERERSSNETPRIKRPMKAVQSIALERETPNAISSSSRAEFHAFESMPPPSAIPNRTLSAGTPLQIPNYNSSFYHPRSSQSRKGQNEPLFLPSSQLSAADEAALKSIGLEAEDMDPDQLADLLESEGEEVDFSLMSQVHAFTPNSVQSMHSDNNSAEKPLELIEDSEFSATPSSKDANKVCLYNES
ncbi:hypothetical protein BDN70DRAFT_825463 [Pholiota conissans]|uniref:Cell cycle checkpoint control protein n=1 Tax=Pholiota conissans TaxID=109636 RepID=A0A9P5ZAE6_9AGAR|nr:hypothetical protein BDN70DRAFT_825463 [Pholiota conissans]